MNLKTKAQIRKITQIGFGGRDARLHPMETQTQMFGCRLFNPDACVKNSLRQVCAFVREDGLCQSPPRTWPRLFQTLKEKSEANLKR